ncbi:MAG: DNA adenine methylase, partial [Gammaproteobacteria bacterium]|nr:DNA adenine methylase [Gammaproteobacteria bacterium]
HSALSCTKSKFILSTWHHNDYRKNEYIESLWSDFNILTREHFYHVGGSEKNRNPMIEAIVTNYDTSIFEYQEQKRPEQLMLLEAG